MNNVKVYVGNPSTREVRVVEPSDSRDGEKTYQLNPRFDIVNHSPDGFNWGYGGSGPSQLAFAIMSDLLKDDQKAMRTYQEFKNHFLVKADMNSILVIGASDIEMWLMSKEQNGSE